MNKKKIIIFNCPKCICNNYFIEIYYKPDIYTSFHQSINSITKKQKSKQSEFFHLGIVHSKALDLCCGRLFILFFFFALLFYAIYVMKQLRAKQPAINLGAKERHFQTWNVQIKYWLESHCYNGMRLTLQMQILLPIRMQRGKIVNFIWRSKSEIQWLWKNPETLLYDV